MPAPVGAEGHSRGWSAAEPLGTERSNVPAPVGAEEVHAEVPGTYAQILLHVVFSTKRRVPAITPDLQRRLYDYIGGIIRGEKGVLYEIGGMPDHVHLLFRWRTDESTANLMRQVKSRSSRWVHQTFANQRDFQWQDGYGVFSVSQSRCESVKQYIREQAQHHCQRPFEDEFRELLKAHEIQYDERYLLD